MREFYFRNTTNFGDALNSWLWSELFPGMMNPDDGIRLVGVGSLIKADLARVEGLKVVFGSGSGYGSLPDLGDPQQWRVYFVRGPLTAQAAKLPAAKGIVDAAWLIGLMDAYRTLPAKSGIGFIPHFSNAQLSAWGQVCEHAGVKFIDPLAESRAVLAQIASSELIVTESLHGAIMADLFRTPWIPVKLSRGAFLDFKWRDWCQSVNLDARVYSLPPTDLFDHLRQGVFPGGEAPLVSSPMTQGGLRIDPHAGRRKASALYKLRTKLRTKAHDFKERSFNWLSRHRNPWGTGGINRRLVDGAGKHLLRVSREKPLLSSDLVREEKLQQLAEQVAELRRDYQNGLFGNSAKAVPVAAAR